ncbi:MAG: hypothetical protein ACE5GW_02300, partial [Planctomycetota bacterium]
MSRKLRVEKIEIRDLQRLFLSVSQTLGEKKVRPVNHTDRAVTLRFLRRITGMTSQEIEEHFVQLELHDRLPLAKATHESLRYVQDRIHARQLDQLHDRVALSDPLAD